MGQLLSRALRRLGPWLLGSCCWWSLPALADQHWQQLASSPQWQALLHFDNGRSRVDAAAFFLHPQGQQDAAAELIASRQTLLEQAAVRCRFPARLAFLAKHDDALAALPPTPCAEYARWREKLNPQALTLVFAAAYLGNPSSMFGHTFLRLDSGGSALLDWALNFAAQTQDPVGLRFAYQGATGGYPGRFGLAPYYDKVSEYARLEQRDLWEYPLQLSAADIELLLQHLWEMREAWFEYYFFQENCSFQLLALLQVLRPELPLTDGFTLFAAPVDTLRRLKRHGLVAAPRLRPAVQSDLRARIAQLPPQGRAWLRDQLAAPQALQAPASAAAMTQAEQAAALEVLIDLAAYRAEGRAPAAWQDLREQALAWRSQMTASLPSSAPPALPPDAGHLSQRFSLGWSQQSSRNAWTLGWRPVLHDALDGARGLPRGSEISVLDVHLQARAGNLRLQQLQLFEVRALPLRDAWFAPPSWQLGLGYARDHWGPAGDGFVRASAGFGRTYGVSRWPALRHSYLLHGSLLWGATAGRALQSTLMHEWQGQWHPDWPWRARLLLRRRDGLIADAHRWRAFAELGQQWQLSPAWGLRLQWQREHSRRASRWQLGLAHYF